MSVILKIIRQLFFHIDKIVYGLVDEVYGLLLQLTRTSIFNQDIIHSFAIRVYALIGIFMLFKVSISLLTYLLNPDDFASKEKGFGIVIRNVILALVILVISPYVFNEAYEVQSMILEENTIMNLIFGTPSDNGSSSESVSYNSGSFLDNYVNDAGGKIQFTLLYAFAQPNYEEFAHDKTVADLIDCNDTYARDSEGNFTFRKKAVIEKDGNKTSNNETSRFIYELNPSCFGVYNSETDTYEMDGKNGQLWKAFDDADATVAYQNYAQGIAQQSFNLFFTEDAIMAKTTDGRYLINYKFIVSTAVGVAVLYFLLMFCIDIALRSVKLGFLEMIAPIPIISYCDPKSSKDGMFKKWLDMLWKTYLELFMRLFALYFGIYVISIVGTFRDVVTGYVVDDLLVNVFMILGILIFVKKLPDILKEVFNIKGDGKFEFNPLKRIENDAIGGKTISKGLGAATGVGVGALASAAGLVTGKGIHRATFGKAIAGGWNGEKFGKNFANSYSAGKERHKELQNMSADGVKRGEVFANKAQNAFGLRTRGERAEALDANLKAYTDNGEAIKNAIYANDKATGSLTANGRTFNGAKGLKEFIDQMQAPVQQVGETAAQFATRQQAYLVEKKKYQDALDEKVSAIATGREQINDGTTDGSSGGAAAQAAVEKLVTTMDKQSAAINAEGKALYGNAYSDIGDIKGNSNATALKNALGAAAGAKTTVSANSGHDKDIQKYAGGKKS